MYQPAGKDGSEPKYRQYTWKEYRDIVREIAVGLRAVGIQKSDVVCIYSETRAEFYLADIGVMTCGAIAAALYTSYPMADQVKNLLAARPKAIIVENERARRGMLEALNGQPFETRWILLTGEGDGAITMDEVRAEGRRLLAGQPGVFDEIQQQYTDHDYAILYLTSGATGEPKMGLATHSAVVSNIDMGPAVLPLTPEDRSLVFLPSAHIAQRIVLELLPIRMGMPVWFSEGLAKMPSEMRSIRPTFLLAPPRVWERIYATIWTEVRKRPAVAQRMFYAAIGVGSEAARLKQQGKPVPPWIRGAQRVFDRLVYSKVRERLGGKMRIAASGAAPLSKDLAEFYAAIGMPLIEGYGLTEGGVAALNPIDRPKAGSIGKLLPGVEGRLADDGELLLKSPCLFSGYYQDPESTQAVLKDGWLYTGDIAEFDKDGYLYITGRKKELIVSSNGKKIYPSRIEGFFKSEPLINQVVLIGDKMPYVTALLTINTAAAEALKGMEEHRGKPLDQIATAPAVMTEVQQAVSRVNKRLAGFEQIRKFRVLDRDFTIESGELTPTMKVRRNRVLENNRAIISELYLGKEVE
jgi:long-chain acyl-CoA synthetase